MLRKGKEPKARKKYFGDPHAGHAGDCCREARIIWEAESCWWIFKRERDGAAEGREHAAGACGDGEGEWMTGSSTTPYGA